MRRKLIMMVAFCLLAMGYAVSQIQVRGTVTDDKGEAAIGASIRVKDGTDGTITDIDGKFTLSAPAGGTLIVSYIGYKTQEVPVNETVTVTLLTDAEVLDEVIVVAYGTAKRSSFTGSAAQLKTEAIEKRPITNVTSMLEGNSPGVQTTSAMGQPGESPSIRIRGFGSVNASNATLYVVDGAIYSGNVADINPADIESMSVLKDAS